MGRLEGKVAVITGGASGIGKATVKLFIEEGAHVVFGDIQDEQGELLANELGEKAIFVHCNVREESDIIELINRTIEKFKRVDILFNNAGFGGAYGPIDEIPTNAFDVTIEVLFRSVFLGIKHIAPIMKKQSSGSIISTASVAGLRTGMGPHLYSACKAAIIQLTHTTAAELGEFNIRVNCICPGLIITPIFGRGIGLSQEQSERLAQILKFQLKDVQPIGRSGLPEDVAKTALWFSSDESGFVTGHALVVDGGLIWRGIEERNEAELNEFLDKLGLGTIEEIYKKENEKIARSK